MSTTENSKMVSLSYKYTITYTNGWERNLGDYQSMIANIQEEDYLKIVKGVADGLELMEIEDIDSVLEEMSRPEQNMTVYRSDGSHVTLAYKNGTVKYTDSRKQVSVFSMTADAFLNWFVH